jgi:hypothetical protein
MSNVSKLAFNKTTIRTLTDDEVGSVAGGTTPLTPATPYIVASSEPCAIAVVTVITMA